MGRVPVHGSSAGTRPLGPFQCKPFYDFMILSAPVFIWPLEERTHKNLSLLPTLYTLWSFQLAHWLKCPQFCKTRKWVLFTDLFATFCTHSCLHFKEIYILQAFTKRLINIHLILQLNPLSFNSFMWTVCFPIWEFYLESPRRNFNSWSLRHLCDCRRILLFFSVGGL